MRRTASIRIAAATALTVFAVVRAASADDLIVTEAKQRMAEGKRLYAAGQYEAAWLKYKQACVVIQSDNCTRGLALTEFKSKRWLDAYQRLRGLLVPAPNASLAPAVVAELTRMMQEAYARTGHIAVQATPGASLAIDGVTSPGPVADVLDVTPGAHVLEAERAGETRRVDVNAEEGVLVHADVTIPVVSAAPTALVAPSPATPPAETTATPAAGGVERGSGTVSTTGTVVRWGLTGVAVVALGVGVGFDVESHAKASDAAAVASSHPGGCASPSSPMCARLGQVISEGSTSATASYVLVGVSLAAAVGAASAWIWWPHEKSGATAWVLPAAGPHGGGMSAGGSF